MTKKWIKINDLSSGQYSVNKHIRFKISMLRSNFFDYSNSYIVVKRIITVTGTKPNNRRNKNLIFINNVPFSTGITKINNTFVDNAKDLDIVMLMYNLLEYSDNYSMTSGSLWNYHRDKLNYDENKNYENGNKKNNNNTTTSKSFKDKTKIIKSTPNNPCGLNAEVVVPLKYLSNFWRSLDLPLINCEIELDLRWARNCIISKISRTFKAVDPNVDPVVYQVTSQTTTATFQINNAKLYVPLVTLSIYDDIKFLEYIKQGFTRTISWNKYRSEITTLPKNNNLGYLIDPRSKY